MLVPITAVFVGTSLLYKIILWLYPTLNLLDFPERYNLKRKHRLPYPTGIAASAAFLISLVILRSMHTQEWGLVVGIALLSCICFIDDRRTLPSPIRLLTQIIIALIIFLTGSQIYTITNPLGGILKLDTILVSVPHVGSIAVLSGLFTIAWLILTINAMNWLDGVGGQVSVLSTIGFLMIGFLAYFRNFEGDFALLAFVLAAIAGAGILFEFPVPRMLIGDTGSMFFGLMLGVLGIYQGGKVATAFLALGIPLIDALLVILERVSHGRSPFSGGHDHLHHLLIERRGWQDKSVVLLTALLGCSFGGSALFLSTAGKGISLCILALVVMGLRKYARHQQ